MIGTEFDSLRMSYPSMLFKIFYGMSIIFIIKTVYLPGQEISC